MRSCGPRRTWRRYRCRSRRSARRCTSWSTHKARPVEYIERFLAALANRGPHIADLLTQMHATGVERLLRTA
ncbi:DUF2397 family protein [Streptomyces platensis]|uniref:DUF2397 family protein n=1 Tax=Streptomyces platensis TaxID=58346 RepID=UPI0037A7283E